MRIYAKKPFRFIKPPPGLNRTLRCEPVHKAECTTHPATQGKDTI
jgi:hypothetical protein